MALPRLVTAGQRVVTALFAAPVGSALVALRGRFGYVVMERRWLTWREWCGWTAFGAVLTFVVLTLTGA